MKVFFDGERIQSDENCCVFLELLGRGKDPRELRKGGKEKFFICLFVCFGHSMQWLDMGSLFPDLELNLGHSWKSAYFLPLDHQGTLRKQMIIFASMARPGPSATYLNHS